MRLIYKQYLAPTLTVFLVVSANISSLSAQQVTSTYLQIEPARWTQEDVTVQQKYSTAFKEATNAQQQSIDECKALNAAPRNECIANARMAYNQDMAAIRLKFKK